MGTESSGWSVRPALAGGLLGLTFAAAAALFDAEPIWVPAIALSVLALAAVAWVALATRGLTVRRTLSSARVIEDDPLTVVLEVRGGGLALPCSMICDPLLGEPAALPAGRHAARVRIEARFARRGSRRLGPTSVIVSDPLGLASRAVPARASARDDELLVLPRIEPLRHAVAGAGGWAAARNTHRLPGADVEFDGIRPLRDGTPASRIFWPAVARGAEPQERRLRADGDRPPLVVLDPRGAADLEDLDAAVRAAASIAHTLAGAGGCGVLLPGDRRPAELGETLAGWPRVHARLALIGPEGAPSPAIVTRHRGPLVFVSARRRLALPPALGAARGATRLLVVPGSIAGRELAFSVAGCSAHVLDRPRAGRRRRALQEPV